MDMKHFRATGEMKGTTKEQKALLAAQTKAEIDSYKRKCRQESLFHTPSRMSARVDGKSTERVLTVEEKLASAEKIYKWLTKAL